MVNTLSQCWTRGELPGHHGVTLAMVPCPARHCESIQLSSPLHHASPGTNTGCTSEFLKPTMRGPPNMNPDRCHRASSAATSQPSVQRHQSTVGWPFAHTIDPCRVYSDIIMVVLILSTHVWVNLDQFCVSYRGDRQISQFSFLYWLCKSQHEALCCSSLNETCLSTLAIWFANKHAQIDDHWAVHQTCCLNEVLREGSQCWACQPSIRVITEDYT